MQFPSRSARRGVAVAIALTAALLGGLAPASADPPTYEFPAPIFDIDAAPNGAIIAAGGTSIMAAHRGQVRHVIDIPLADTQPPTTVNGVEAIGARNFFVASGGGDLAAGAAVWRVSAGRARLVGDVEAFETTHDPDAFGGPQWKDPRCEAILGFSAGPQSNPFHLARLSGSKALVADAAGNTLLLTKTNGTVDWVAVFTPPVDTAGEYLVQFPLDAETDCYVQPVPTSVDIGPDGAYYVGELTGATADLADAPGLSRVWRIERGARHVTCPSAQCQEVVSGLTSVIDVEFGPDGRLYVVEYDLNGWLSVLLGNPSSGAIRACDVGTGSCSTVADGLTLPGAITFDKRGRLWVLENNIVAPTVRSLGQP